MGSLLVSSIDQAQETRFLSQIRISWGSKVQPGRSVSIYEALSVCEGSQRVTKAFLGLTVPSLFNNSAAFWSLRNHPGPGCMSPDPSLLLKKGLE